MGTRSPWIAAALLALATPVAMAQSGGSVVTNPEQPLSRESLAFELEGSRWPMYLPAMRYTRTGNRFEVEIEYVSQFFGPSHPSVGRMPIPVGELAPGSYEVLSRLYDISQPSAPPEVKVTSFTVIPSDYFGTFLLPVNPYAEGVTEALVMSPYAIYPETVKLTMSGNVARVDFEYVESVFGAPASPPPAGTRSWVMVPLPNLTPGAWRFEAYGKGRSGTGSLTFAAKPFEVSAARPAIEYFAPSTDHYFVTTWPAEIAGLDSGAQPGWKRTGRQFRAWSTQSAGAGAVPVCRFYAAGPNSHFYTANAGECQGLRELEAKGRAQAGSAPFKGWAYEGIAFWALPSAGGRCSEGSDPVYRSFNNRAEQNDSNHRFTTNMQLHNAMTISGNDEGVAFCAPR